MVSELLIRVIPAPPSAPPSFSVPTPLLPPDTVYVAPGSMLTHDLRITSTDTVLGATLLPVTPLPGGASLSGVQIAGTGNGVLQFRCSLYTEHKICETFS